MTAFSVKEKKATTIVIKIGRKNSNYFVCTFWKIMLNSEAIL